MGFCPLLCKLVNNRISFASFSVLVEGSPTPPFTNYRGIRQGDPLSPILFHLVMDNLSRPIEKEIKDKKLDTYVVNGSVSISHLIYVDDVLIFSKANPKSLGTIKRILESFTKFSGLEVNQEKSSTTYSMACSNDQIIHSILNFPFKTLPIRYLGLPITGKKKSYAACWKLINPIEMVLAKWKG